MTKKINKNKSANYIKENNPNQTGATGQNNVILIIILATFFGLGAGIAGTIIIKPFILNEVYNIPFSGEIDLSQDKIRRANLVIENAKKIIVEQDTRVESAINSAKKSIVGVFEEKKIATGTTQSIESGFDIKNYYELNSKIAEGLIITSDGWVLINNFNKKFDKEYIKKNYVIITSDNQVYKIKDAIESDLIFYILVQLENAKELPVKGFVKKNSLTNGQLVISTNWLGDSHTTSVVSQNDKKETIMSSDKTIGNFILSDKLENYFINSFIFNLNNEIVGLFNEKDGIISMDYFQPIIKALLNKKDILRPALGIEYLSLSDFAITDNKYKNGALINKNGVAEGSAAEEAGLEAGDIILSVDNIEINQINNLTDIIQGYLAGEEITVIYLRDQEEKIAKIILKEYEQIN